MELAADGSRAWTKIRTLACLFPLPLLLCLPLTLLHCLASPIDSCYILLKRFSHPIYLRLSRWGTVCGAPRRGSG